MRCSIEMQAILFVALCVALIIITSKNPQWVIKNAYFRVRFYYREGLKTIGICPDCYVKMHKTGTGRFICNHPDHRR